MLDERYVKISGNKCYFIFSSSSMKNFGAIQVINVLYIIYTVEFCCSLVYGRYQRVTINLTQFLTTIETSQSNEYNNVQSEEDDQSDIDVPLWGN